MGQWKRYPDLQYASLAGPGPHELLACGRGAHLHEHAEAGAPIQLRNGGLLQFLLSVGRQRVPRQLLTGQRRAKGVQFPPITG